MSANEIVKQMFRLGLGDRLEAEECIQAFFESDVWNRYRSGDPDPNPSTWDEVVLEVVRVLDVELRRRIARPAVMVHD